MRYCPERELPSYAFRPGQHIHPNKEGGHSYNSPEIVSTQLSSTNLDFLYSIDLFNNSFYWEAHVYLEAIWNFHNRKGSEAQFCKALIKLSAGALKQEMGNTEQANLHYTRSKEIVNGIEDYSFVFYDRANFITTIDKFIKNQKEIITLDI